jgi:hypothetical protein
MMRRRNIVGGGPEQEGSRWYYKHLQVLDLHLDGDLDGFDLYDEDILEEKPDILAQMLNSTEVFVVYE